MKKIIATLMVLTSSLVQAVGLPEADELTRKVHYKYSISKPATLSMIKKMKDDATCIQVDASKNGYNHKLIDFNYHVVNVFLDSILITDTDRNDGIAYYSFPELIDGGLTIDIAENEGSLRWYRRLSSRVTNDNEIITEVSIKINREDEMAGNFVSEKAEELEQALNHNTAAAISNSSYRLRGYYVCQ